MIREVLQPCGREERRCPACRGSGGYGVTYFCRACLGTGKRLLYTRLRRTGRFINTGEPTDRIDEVVRRVRVKYIFAGRGEPLPLYFGEQE